MVIIVADGICSPAEVRKLVMTTRNTAPLQLGVSLHTLDREQRIETVRLLAGSAVQAMEIWEPTFAKGAGHVRAFRAALAAAGVVPRAVHASFGSQRSASWRRKREKEITAKSKRDSKNQVEK